MKKYASSNAKLGEKLGTIPSAMTRCKIRRKDGTKLRVTFGTTFIEIFGANDGTTPGGKFEQKRVHKLFQTKVQLQVQNEVLALV